MRQIILIDDNHATGWTLVFEAICRKYFGDMITLTAWENISNEGIKHCYETHPNALFIQDNQLSTDGSVYPGIHWVRQYAGTRTIVMHTSERAISLILEAARYGVKHFMLKDDPNNSMPDKEFREQMRKFLCIIIEHFDLIPQLIWLFDKEYNDLET